MCVSSTDVQDLWEEKGAGLMLAFIFLRIISGIIHNASYLLIIECPHPMIRGIPPQIIFLHV